MAVASELMRGLGREPERMKMSDNEKLTIAERELLAALGTMLATWDEATEKMVAFMKDPNKNTAEAYSKCCPKMFDAACLARATHDRYRNPQPAV